MFLLFINPILVCNLMKWSNWIHRYSLGKSSNAQLYPTMKNRFSLIQLHYVQCGPIFEFWVIYWPNVISGYSIKSHCISWYSIHFNLMSSSLFKCDSAHYTIHSDDVNIVRTSTTPNNNLHQIKITDVERWIWIRMSVIRRLWTWKVVMEKFQ